MKVEQKWLACLLIAYNKDFECFTGSVKSTIDHTFCTCMCLEYKYIYVIQHGLFPVDPDTAYFFSMDLLSLMSQVLYFSPLTSLGSVRQALDSLVHHEVRIKFQLNLAYACNYTLKGFLG